jgi:hypothetical protein
MDLWFNPDGRKVPRLLEPENHQFSPDEMVPLCDELAEFIHFGHYRDSSGEPFITHPRKVKERVECLLRPSKYKDPALCSALTHEFGEVDGCEIYEPFGPKNKELTYLYNVLAVFGEKGTWTCYMDNKLTHRKGIHRRGIPYHLYMKRISSSSQSVDQRVLDKIGNSIKAADMNHNTDPDEAVNKEACNQIYTEYKKAGELILLSKEYGLSVRNPHNMSFERFFESLENKVLYRKVRNATDVKSYLKDAEEIILGGMGSEGIFDAIEVRELIKECIYKSDVILKKYVGLVPQDWIWSGTGKMRS